MGFGSKMSFFQKLEGAEKFSLYLIEVHQEPWRELKSFLVLRLGRNIIIMQLTY